MFSSLLLQPFITRQTANLDCMCQEIRTNDTDTLDLCFSCMVSVQARALQKGVGLCWISWKDQGSNNGFPGSHKSYAGRSMQIACLWARGRSFLHKCTTLAAAVWLASLLADEMTAV